MSLPHTRRIIDAIHDGTLDAAECRTDPRFGFEVPVRCDPIPVEMLWPRDAWPDPESYDSMSQRLADLFHQNFLRFESGTSEAIRQAGPSA